VRTGRDGFPRSTANWRTRFFEIASGHLSRGYPIFPDLPPLPGQNHAYGMATVLLYVGAVKRVALPIVSQAINRRDAQRFPQGRCRCLPPLLSLRPYRTWPVESLCNVSVLGPQAQGGSVESWSPSESLAVSRELLPPCLPSACAVPAESVVAAVLRPFGPSAVPLTETWSTQAD